MEESLLRRLEILRRRGNPGVAPLWAELLTPAELLLDDRFAPGNPLTALLRAKALAALGRREEAAQELNGVEASTRGAAFLRDEIAAEIDALPQDSDKGPLPVLEGWLANVELWREKLEAGSHPKEDA